MKATSLTYLLLILIALQSVFTVAKAESFHQDEPEQFAQAHQQQQQHEHEHEHEHEHQHENGTQLSSVNQNDDHQSNHNHADCHHCGHCQGPHLPWANTASTLRVHLFSDINAYWYHSTLIAGSASRLLRPPKA